VDVDYLEHHPALQLPHHPGVKDSPAQVHVPHLLLERRGDVGGRNRSSSAASAARSKFPSASRTATGCASSATRAPEGTPDRIADQPVRHLGHLLRHVLALEDGPALA